MQHRASLVSGDTSDEVDVLLDLGAGRVEMFVEDTSVGRWPLGVFISAPDARGGFRLNVDGERWRVVPKDHPLFLADALPRLPRFSRARLVNRFPRAGRGWRTLREPEGKRRIVWYAMAVAMSAGSFGIGALVGRYRVDGSNLATWLLIGTLAAIAVVVARVIVRESARQGQLEIATREASLEYEAPAVSRLLATLDFVDPTARRAPPPKPAEDSPLLAWARSITSGQPNGSEPPAPTELPEAPVEPTTVEPAFAGSDLTMADDHATVAEFTVPGVDTPLPPPEPTVAPPRPADAAPEAATPAQPAALRRPAPRVVVINVDGERDDLTTIHGIGPTYAAILEELGIHSFRELAAIDRSTLDVLRERMGKFAGRIERDRWIQRAAEAQRAKTRKRSARTPTR